MKDREVWFLLLFPILTHSVSLGKLLTYPMLYFIHLQDRHSANGGVRFDALMFAKCFEIHGWKVLGKDEE